MAILGFELEEIQRYIQMLENSGLDEICIKEETRYLRLRGPKAVEKVAAPVEVVSTVHAPPVHRSHRALPASPGKGKDSTSLDDANHIALSSPMMGMFYRAEKPGGPPLVNVGQHVSVGQVIGIIEAMKIFSEVLAEHSGVVAAVPAEDGQLVQAGSPLVILRKEA